ncbi:hypothetical protein HUJ05_005585 [Dendroctonus ponderosae]|nr:hypothetical protein HUJ05_005585 [Dendroctonus ponderosae]
MSTGKRIAKRSIIGTRVCAPGEDGKYYSGVIQAVKTPASVENNSNCINLTPNTRYTVRFDSRQGTLGRTSAEFFESDLIGPGFQSVLGTELVQHQKCFVTFNGREISGEVMKHHLETDEVIIRIHPIGTDVSAFILSSLDQAPADCVEREDHFSKLGSNFQEMVERSWEKCCLDGGMSGNGKG